MEKTILELLREKGVPATDPTNTMIADTVASSAPAILALLGGADTTSVNRQLAKGNQYLSTRGDQEVEALKNMKQIDVDGMPVNVKPVDALYQQDYEKKALNNALKQYKPQEMINTVTKKVTRGLVTSNGIFDETTGEKLGPEYRFYQRPSIKESTDVQGTERVVVIDPVTLEPKIAYTTPGLGTVYDTATKGQAENIEDLQKEGSKDVYAINKQIGRLEQIENELNATNDPRVAGATAYGLARDIEPKGVLTDTDIVRILGMDRMTFVDRFKQAVASNITGDVQKYTRSFKELVKAMRIAKRKEAENIQGIIPKGGPKSKAPKGEQVAPLRKPSKEAKAKYVEYEKQAKSMMKDPKMIKSFLDKKKLELGL